MLRLRELVPCTDRLQRGGGRDPGGLKVMIMEPPDSPLPWNPRGPKREGEVMRLVVDGRSAAEVADELVISVHTVRNHIGHAYEKRGVRNRAAAVAVLLRADSDSKAAPPAT